MGMQTDYDFYVPVIVDDPNEPLSYDAEWIVVLDDWTDGVGRSPQQILADLQNGGMGSMGHGSMPGMNMPGMGGLGHSGAPGSGQPGGGMLSGGAGASDLLAPAIARTGASPCRN